MSKSRYPGIERLSSGRYRVRVTWIDPKTGRTWNNLLRQVASGAITRSMIGHETEEMFLHYSHIERDEKQGAVERALALVDGPKVEHRVEGSPLGDDDRNAGGSETTRND